MDSPKEEDHGGGGSDSAAHQHQESSVLFDYFGDLYSRDYLESWLQTSGPRNEVAGGPNHEVVLTVDDVKPLWGSTSEEQATEDPRFGQQNPVHRINASPDVYQDWHRTGFLSQQESFLHHHATRRHLDFDAALMPCHSSTPRSHGSYADHNHAGYGSNHAGYSSGVLPPSLMNLGHSLLGNGEPQESSGWQQFSDARKMPFQYRSNQETFIQLPQDMNFSSTFSDPFREVSDLVGDGQHADEVTDIPKSWSRAKASKLQDHESVVDSNSVTPRRRGKKAANALEDGSCKTCNCRRSKCLKLYCECFAAGLYCIDSCACEGCYNSLNFEDTVSETRKQIESHNSLAFGPKVIQHATDSSPEKVEGSGSEATPSSARHKRGCNCKKSQCTKRYCECYQGKAGCSYECNCENCCNPFSPKPDMNSKAAEQGIERREMSPHGKLDGVQGMPDSIINWIGGRSASSWEGTVNMLNNTSSLSPLADFSHPKTRGCSSSTQVEGYQGSVPVQLPFLPIDMPPSDGDKAIHDLVHVSTTHNMADGVNICDVGTSSLLKPASASLPNHRQESTLQFRQPGWSPNIFPSSRHGFKPDLRTHPSPDGKSDGGSRQA